MAVIATLEDAGLVGVYRCPNSRGGAGAYGVPAGLEFGASPARAVLPRSRPGALRALFRRGVAHGHPRRCGLVLLAGSNQDGLGFLPVVRAQGPRERPRPAAGL